MTQLIKEATLFLCFSIFCVIALCSMLEALL
jgi:hypothetical protein